MPQEKKNVVVIAIGIGVAVLVIFVIFMFMGRSGEKNVQADKVSSAPVASTTKPPDQLTSQIVKDSILKSIDGGETFLPYFTIASVVKVGTADILTLSFHPTRKNRIVATTFQDGLFVNESGVNTWAPINFPPKKIYSFILDKNSPDNRVFASGVVDNNGRIFRTDDAGVNWKAVYAEPGVGTYISGLAQHPRKPNIILAGTNNGTLVRSEDGGSSWKNIGSKIDGTITYFAFDVGTKPFSYFLSFQKKIYVSRDDGVTWQNWEDEKKKEVEALNARAQELTRAGDKEGGRILREQSAVLARRNTENKTPAGIIYIATDPSKSGTIYAGTGGGLYRSNDFGKYWTKLNIIESAEKFPIRSIAVNPKNSNEIVFVAGKTFYRSRDYGETWAITPLTNDRMASFVAYDPFDANTLFIGVSTK